MTQDSSEYNPPYELLLSYGEGISSESLNPIALMLRIAIGQCFLSSCNHSWLTSYLGMYLKMIAIVSVHQ